MKIIYTILFFLGTVMFFGLVYMFIKLSNSETGRLTPGLVLVAIVACVSFLTYLLYRVMNSNDSNNENIY